MIRTLYDRTLALARHRHATWWMAFVSFIESSVFPIPPDVLLGPMVLAQRQRAWWLATVCTIASALGGLLGYAIGYLAFEGIGAPILEFFGYGEKFGEFAGVYDEWGFWIVFGAGLTPFPFKVITIASGFAEMNLAIFFIGCVVGRSIRFFLVAGLLYFFGPPIQAFVEKRLGLVTAIVFLVVIAAILAARLL